ncbi:MAG: multicopper oxidase [Caldilinea sp.]|uniref:multicopper oxidase family protein n=1 Tax=Caldilinea sp. TaxID=2293560 RepID=UPI002BB0486D|nr:multicopper oxidase domain-containing protein [Anaerolineales bacterium]HQY91971.1 multicopper oxidase [Caldilinea sp.]
MILSRRNFLKSGAFLGASVVMFWRGDTLYARSTESSAAIPVAQLPGGTLDPAVVPKYQTPLVIPPVMPRTGRIRPKNSRAIDYYEIAVRQFDQQILPAGFPTTTVWSYGSLKRPGTVAQGGSFNYPALTIEAKYDTPVRVKWINQLVDKAGNYLPHLFAVDPTLHWANPAGGMAGRDHRPHFHTTPGRYTGPVPMVTHLHGAVDVGDESDGYAEAWFLPAAKNISVGYATSGTWYETFRHKFFAERAAGHKSDAWDTGACTSQYPNIQRATTLWYHDHTLGMTRLNVYAGPAGFYILRGGPDDNVRDVATRKRAVLPAPAPQAGDWAGRKYYEIPIVIQDRSFNVDGSLYYPDHRAFFEDGRIPEQLQIPFIGAEGCTGPSDISPIWNPEFFGNMMVVNGCTWPFLNVSQCRYRLRLLNGCNSRFLLLKFDHPGVKVWQIGNEGGYLPTPVDLNAVANGQILLSPAERADVIVDFADVPFGANVTLINLGPDEPFGGGAPDEDYESADPATTGQVMQFRVVSPQEGPEAATPPERLALPQIAPLGAETFTRKVALLEEESRTVNVIEDAAGNIVQACNDPNAEAFGPSSAVLGRLIEDPQMPGKLIPVGDLWMEPITENPNVNDVEIWEIYNYTMDAHPIHIHEVAFEVVNRQALDMMTNQPAGPARLPEAWEAGRKDTVIAYPGEITRVKARFDTPGLFVWHCHIVEHEDNEMMRPYAIGAPPAPMVMAADAAPLVADESAEVEYDAEVFIPYISVK